MPSLQVRNLPDHVYAILQQAANKENRSLAQETIYLLKKALNMTDGNHEKRKAILKKISDTVTSNYNDLPEPAAMVREDRSR